MNSKMVLLSVGVVLLLVGALAGYLYGVNSTPAKTTTVTSTTTVSASLDAYEQVSDAYAYHLMQLSDRNMSAVVGEYESNATVEWTGVVAGMNGNYSGAANIGILLGGDFFGKLINSSLSNEYQSVGVNGNVSEVNSTFNFQGYNAVEGNVNGTIVAQDTYEHVGNLWLIAHEAWNFTRYYVQFYVGTG
jgi:hypothetical protein